MTFAAKTPVSVSTQVVEVVTHSMRSSVTGAVAKKSTVLDAVATLPRVDVKLPEVG